jgi:hypothetical protein
MDYGTLTDQQRRFLLLGSTAGTMPYQTDQYLYHTGTAYRQAQVVDYLQQLGLRPLSPPTKS